MSIRIICSCCGRDINAIHQTNMSYIPNKPLCEDCGRDEFSFDDYAPSDNPIDADYATSPKRLLSKKQFKFLMKYAGWSYMRVKNVSYDVAIDKISKITYMMQQNKLKRENRNNTVQG